MTLKEILNTTEEESVLKILSTVYEPSDNDMEGYSSLLKKLRVMTPVASEYQLCIQHVVGFDGYEYEHVSGIKYESDESVGLSLTPKEEWLGVEILDDTLASYSPEEILAHCLWEMTFYGFTEGEVEGFKEYLNNIDLEDCSELDLRDLGAEEKPKKQIDVNGVTFTSDDVRDLLKNIRQYEK